MSCAGNVGFAPVQGAGKKKFAMNGARAGASGAMAQTLVLTVAAGFVFTAAGCAEPNDSLPNENVGSAKDAIIGGEITTGDPAVVMVVSYPSNLSTFDTCTGSVVAKDVVLTAAHCLDAKTHPNYLFGVFIGADATMFETASTLVPKLLPAKEVAVHPDYDPKPPFTADIGVLVLSKPLDILPLPVQFGALSNEIVGEPARIIGYGQPKYNELSSKRRVATTVVASLEAGDTIKIGDFNHLSCIGDSGGPALSVIDGEERVIGVDSYTDLSGCLEPAHYRRTDVYASFLKVYAPQAGSGGGAGSGGTGGANAGGANAGGGGTGASATDGGDMESGGCGVAPAQFGNTLGGASGPWQLSQRGVLSVIGLLGFIAVGSYRRKQRPKG